MIHIFDTDIAEKYGINAAIILQNIGYWIKQNEANETNYFDGYYWTFNSRRAYRELFPYMSERQINTAFEKLINDGVIITGNYNRVAYDRTLWYALTQKGKCILHFDIMETDKMSNGASQNGKPIPNNKPIFKTKDIKPIKKERKTSYDAILKKIENDSLRELYLEYIKMRKMIKSPMTDKALQMLINKVEKLEPTDIERQKKLLEASIMNNWKSVYPLKDENAKTPKRQEPKPKWFKQEQSSFDIDEFDRDTLGAYITEKPNEQELAKRKQELKERLKNKYGKERKEAQI